MIILDLKGGLANQMFIYALYEKLKSLGMNIKCNSHTHVANYPFKYELDKFPNVRIDFADAEEIDELRKYSQLIYNSTSFWEKIFYVDDETYLECFFQSELYFKDIRDAILDRFMFPELTDKRNIEYMNNIDITNSVSIHIRRGDYLADCHVKLYGNICTLDYYQKAIEYFENKYGDVDFFVFSNDIEWTKQNISAKKIHYVEGNENNNIADMHLMSKCKHNIIANSTYSWWGAWLNQNPNKEVIAPDKWYNKDWKVDIWCEGWHRIKG